MQISSRFTIAVHIFLCIHTFEKERKVTSDFLASSVEVNPVVIRRILLQLKAAGLVNVQRGTGGATIARPLEEITFLDIYKAVECVEGGKLFHFHENPNMECPVGRNIHNVLDGKLERIQKAMEQEMEFITLADIARELDRCLKAGIELLEVLSEAEDDVKNGRIAPVSDTFDDLRKMLLED